MKNAAFRRKGGKVRSSSKTAANRAKAAAYRDAVRTGQKPVTRRLRTPPTPEAVGNMLAEYCRQTGITRLEAFGSTTRGEAKRGSDVDLLATFAVNPGRRFYTMEEEMAAILGVPVHLLTRDSVEQLSNVSVRPSASLTARKGEGSEVRFLT
ncbi:MAG: nucleotidyltransferase domain-containing protein [Opitutaceae bacterium]